MNHGAAAGRLRLARHLVAIGLLPFTVTVIVPALVLRGSAVNIGWGLPSGLASLPPLFGLLMLGSGLLLVFRTVALFATVGDGTLAPWDPPQKLVVTGPYRRVRNPMISGVIAILLGEATLLGSAPLLAWFLIFFAINAVTMPLIEEPRLEERFGDDYVTYKRNVPRWLPRLTPWAPARRPPRNS